MGAARLPPHRGRPAIILALRERVKMAAGDRFLLLLIGLGIVAALLILLRQVNYGIGLDGDSLAYLSAARSLAAGDGLVTAGGWPITLIWPPLFPLLAGLPGYLGVDAAVAASLLNAGAFGALVSVAGWWARRGSGSTALGLWAALAVMLAPPVSEQAYQAMSEPLFILLVALALVQVGRFLDGGRRRTLIWAAVFTALAGLTRYMGVAVAITAALLLLWHGDRPAEKAKNIALYLLIAIAPSGVFQLLNRWLAGSFKVNLPPDNTLSQNLFRMTENLAAWPLPGAWSDDNIVIAALLTALTLAPAVIALALALWRRRERGRWNGALAVAASFTLIYLTLLPLAASIALAAWLENRYLSPAYAPLTLAAAGVAAWWMRRNAGAAILPDGRAGNPSIRPAGDGGQRWAALRTERVKTALRRAPLVVLFIWLAYPLTTTAMDINRAISEGTGRYSNARWVNSELVGYINRHLAGVEYGQLYSNDEHVTYFHSGILARLLPVQRSDLYRVYQNQAAAAGVYVVWFEDVKVRRRDRGRDYGKEELAAALPYPQRLFEDRDGALYYVGPESIARGIGDAVAEIGAPAIADVYAVYLGANRLLYVKEPCAAGDTAARFYLHIVPADNAELSAARRGYGFANRDFDFERFGLRTGDRCLISVPLPEWELTEIRTGQYTAAGRQWAGEFAAGAQ